MNLRISMCTTLLLMTSPALAGGIESACGGDYQAYCSHTEPFSAACKSCMRAHRHSLSKQCLIAIRDSGMASKMEIAEFKNGKSERGGRNNKTIRVARSSSR